MKSLFGFIVILCLGCCQSSDFVPCETPIVGKLNVDTNYPDWHNSSCRYGYNSKEKIGIALSSLDALCSKDELTISYVDLKLGRNASLHSNVSESNGYTSFIEYNGEDAVEGIFKLINVNTNFLEIENIDTIQDEIKGRFNLTFIPDTLLQTKFKDTVYFKNSTFTAKLVK